MPVAPSRRRALLVGGLVVALFVPAAARSRGPAPDGARVRPQAAAPASSRWFKGNTHTHTVNSDGDSTPDEVVRWYREHGYNFLVLSDHNYLTPTAGLNAVYGAPDKFIVIPGEEVTMTVTSKPVHVNGVSIASYVAPPTSPDNVVGAIQWAVDGVRRMGGVPHVNHPNFGWGVTTEELARVERLTVFEIYNGHPQVNNAGGGGLPGLEEMWDRLLTGGRLLYGVAVDDAHHFKRPGDPTASTPGRGWVHVRAEALEPRMISEAIDRGDFYASTGVELTDYAADAKHIALKVRTTAYSRYRVQFIGREGRVLSEVTESTASYTFKGDEGYVRAKVLESNGLVAWTQPVPVGREGQTPPPR
jgi:hypothetical protein